MKTSLHIEGHNPVPLVPLGTLDFRDLEPVYLGTIHDRGTVWINPDGTVRYERVELNRWVRWFDSRVYDVETGEDLNLSPCPRASLGRRLQPDERLVVIYEGKS